MFLKRVSANKEQQEEEERKRTRVETEGRAAGRRDGENEEGTGRRGTLG